MLKNILGGLLIGTAVLGLTGCTATKDSKYARNTNDTTKTARIADVIEFYGEELTEQEEQSLLNSKTLYFGYNSFELTGETRRVALAHAKKLLSNPKLTFRVDGHTDERGSREYNIALGERRAKAVASLLQEKGVSSSRIKIVSYGKENPVDLDSNEASWSKNRRAELDYNG